MSLSVVLDTADPTTGKAVSGDLAGYVTLPAFIQRMGTTRSLGMETLCLMGLCWVEDGRVRLQRYHEKAGLGRRLHNAEGYPFDLLSPEGVEYAQSRWSECLSSVERWYRRERDGRTAQAGVSLACVPTGASTTEKVAFLKKEHPELKQQEVANVLGVSLRTVERCYSGLRKSSRVVGRAVSYIALEPATKNSGCVAKKTRSGRLSLFDPGGAGSPDYDPAEDIIHDTSPDGRPCVVDGFPFDLDSALKESRERHASKAKVLAQPRPPSPRFDGLDCRKEALRIANHSEDNCNKAPRHSRGGPFKGISFRHDKGRWEARIRAGDHRRFLGYFDTAHDAASAYDRAAKELHGAFARTNVALGLLGG